MTPTFEGWKQKEVVPTSALLRSTRWSPPSSVSPRYLPVVRWRRRKGWPQRAWLLLHLTQNNPEQTGQPQWSCGVVLLLCCIAFIFFQFAVQFVLIALSFLRSSYPKYNCGYFCALPPFYRLTIEGDLHTRSPLDDHRGCRLPFKANARRCEHGLN